MKPVVPQTTILATTIALTSLMFVPCTIEAQSPADHMQGQMMQHQQPNDTRQLATMPPQMQEHMLANMRDHLQTLNSVFSDIADGKFDAASKVLEERLGMSSLPLHQAVEMAPFFPQPMQDAGTSMHRAASRLAIALQDASVTQTFDAMRAVSAGFREVTASCVACHASYRIR